MKKIIIGIMVLVVSVLAEDKVKFYNPSFDCANVKQDSIEYKICTSKDLSKLDEKLNVLYKIVTQNPILLKTIKPQQRKWLKNRDRCKTKECIISSYKEQIKQITQTIQNYKTFPKQMISYIEKAKQTKRESIRIQTVNGVLYSRAVSSGKIIKDYSEEEKAKMKKDKLKYGDFCKNFYDDLFEFKNIKVIEPLVYMVDYNNTILKEQMGKCHDMGMEYTQEGIYFLLDKEFDPSSYSLWLADLKKTGEKKLLFGQHTRSQNFIYMYILDKNKCKVIPREKIRSSQKDIFRIYEETFQVQGDTSDDSLRLVEYKGEDYLLRTTNYINEIRINLYGQIFDIDRNVNLPECTKTYYISKGER